jgi:hypothetical protein
LFTVNRRIVALGGAAGYADGDLAVAAHAQLAELAGMVVKGLGVLLLHKMKLEGFEHLVFGLHLDSWRW